MRRQYGFDLGDERLNARAEVCLDHLGNHPWESFTKSFPRSSELEGFYRFLHNDQVSVEALMRATRQHAFAQVQGAEALVVHDTTTIAPSSKTLEEFEDLHGYWAHVSLLVSSPETEVELYGPVELTLITKPKGQRPRWHQQANRLEESADRPQHLSLIHVMDSEADSAEIWGELTASHRRFVVRVSRNRKAKSVRGLASRLFAEVEKAEVLGSREVMLSKRSASFMPHSQLRHASRDAKQVTLKLAARSIELHLRRELPSGHRVASEETVRVNVVRAFEHKKATTGSNTVDWILLTSEPIESLADIEKVITIYQRRWVIEEYFKALKTGCRLQERLIADAEAWFNLTALLLPVASQVLNLKMRAEKNLKLTREALSESQWEILKIKARDFKLKLDTYAHLQLLVAKLGGHLKHNGPPGWITLLRGWLELQSMAAGWELAMRSCDK